MIPHHTCLPVNPPRQYYYSNPFTSTPNFQRLTASQLGFTSSHNCLLMNPPRQHYYSNPFTPTSNFKRSTVSQLSFKRSVISSLKVQRTKANAQYGRRPEKRKFSDYIEEESHKQIGKQMMKLHSSDIFDLTIEADGKTFKVAKYVLMSQSEVFKGMLLSSNSNESRHSVIRIDNFSSKTIEALINWMYTREIENLDEIAEDLFKVADKYAFNALKKICLRSMIKGLSLANFPSRLLIAFKYNEEMLKYQVVDFIRGDREYVHYLMGSEEWINFAYNETEQAKKILTVIFK